jgi:enterochelin esterase family protein
MIVVMPDGQVGMTKPADDPFTRELLGSIMPLIEARYRTRADRRGRALAGFSMGGLQALNVGLFQPDQFSQLGIFGSGWFPGMLAEIEQQHQAVVAAAGKRLDLLWVARGRDDRLTERNNQRMLELFDRLGIRYTYVEADGGHTWGPVRHFLAAFAPLLFRQ